MIDVKLTDDQRHRMDVKLALTLIQDLEKKGLINHKTMENVEKIAKKELEKER